MTKDITFSVRMTVLEKTDLDAAALLQASSAGALAAGFISEGLRRQRFPAIDFRDSQPGRVAYLAGTRWPVWMIADLLDELSGNTAAAAKHMRKPAALVRMALAYAKAFPEEIKAAQQLATELEKGATA
jgi:hypothetical protein